MLPSISFQVGDRLFSAFGQDTIDALFWTATEPRNRKRDVTIGVLPHFALAATYVFLHTLLVLLQEGIQLALHWRYFGQCFSDTVETGDKVTFIKLIRLTSCQIKAAVCSSRVNVGLLLCKFTYRVKQNLGKQVLRIEHIKFHFFDEIATDSTPTASYFSRDLHSCRTYPW